MFEIALVLKVLYVRHIFLHFVPFILNRISKHGNDDGGIEDSEGHISIFTHHGCSHRLMLDDEYKNAHRYVLFNCG